MNNAASVSPEVVLDEVRRTLGERQSAAETIRKIRRLVEAPTSPRPVELTDRGWPVLRSAGARDDVPEAP